MSSEKAESHSENNLGELLNNMSEDELLFLRDLVDEQLKRRHGESKRLSLASQPKTPSTDTQPKHIHSVRRTGFPDDFKQKVLRYYVKTGIQNQTAKMFGISTKAVRNWCWEADKLDVYVPDFLMPKKATERRRQVYVMSQKLDFHESVLSEDSQGSSPDVVEQRIPRKTVVKTEKAANSGSESSEDCLTPPITPSSRRGVKRCHESVSDDSLNSPQTSPPKKRLATADDKSNDEDIIEIIYEEGNLSPGQQSSRSSSTKDHKIAFKLNVINFLLKKNISEKEAAAHFDLSESLVKEWNKNREQIFDEFMDHQQ